MTIATTGFAQFRREAGTTVKKHPVLFSISILIATLLVWTVSAHRYESSAPLQQVALNHLGDTRYEAAKWNGWYRPGSNKCNQAVADWIVSSGLPRPSVPGHFGVIPRDPSAHEWADPGITIPGWSAPFARSQAQPGDVIAQQHGPVYAHVGIVVAPGKTVSAYGEIQPAGLVTENDWGFRTAPGANGEGSSDPEPVVRRPLLKAMPTSK